MTALFPRSSFIGFDPLLDELSRLSRQNDSYPPHNVVKIDDKTYCVELALAGFKQNELSIEVNDRTMIVSGEHFTDSREYVHKGISAKKFRRVFTLSEYVHVGMADLVDGILSIQLNIVLPEEKQPRKIQIGSTQAKAELLVE